MYHYKARVYSPTLGRFLQTDPIGYDDQVNLYAYVGNDPVSWTDSKGEEKESINYEWKSNRPALWVISKAVEGAVVLWNAAVGLYNGSSEPRTAETNRNVPAPMTQSQLQERLNGVTVYRL